VTAEAGTRSQHAGRLLRRAVALLFRQPAVWAWPLAVWLVLKCPPGTIHPAIALPHCYLPALGWVLVGCLPSLFSTAPPLRAPQPTYLSRRVLSALTVGVLVGATLVRFWNLSVWPPPGIGFEEFQIGGRAWGASAPGWDFPLRNFLNVYTQPGEHALTVYATSLGFSALGPGFLELRLVFVVAGTLSPFLLYAVCRRLVSWEVSLFAVALFAVCWWQIAASRAADEIFFPIWVELAVLWLLLHFEETGRSWAAFLLALLSGLLIYEYTSYHMVPLLVIGYLLSRLAGFALHVLRLPSAADRWPALRAALHTYGAGVIAMAMTWVIVGHFQLLRDFSHGWSSYFAGGVTPHSADPDALFVQLKSPAGLPAFLLRKLSIPLLAAWSPNHGAFCSHTGLGQHPAFDVVTAVCLGLGFLLVAATPRRRFHALVWIWAMAVIGGAALLPQNPNLHRYYMGLPLFYLIIALGAQIVWQAQRTPAARRAVLIVFAAAVAYASVANLHYFFAELIPDQARRDSWRFPRTEVAGWIRAHDRRDWICLVADDQRDIYGANPLQPEWHWLVDGWNLRVADSAAGCIPAPPDATGDLYYIDALPDRPSDFAAVLRAQYPTAREKVPIAVPHHDFLAPTYVVPAAVAAPGRS